MGPRSAEPDRQQQIRTGHPYHEKSQRDCITLDRTRGRASPLPRLRESARVRAASRNLKRLSSAGAIARRRRTSLHALWRHGLPQGRKKGSQRDGRRGLPAEGAHYRTGTRLFYGFVIFQGFAGRKIFPSEFRAAFAESGVGRSSATCLRSGRKRLVREAAIAIEFPARSRSSHPAPSRTKKRTTVFGAIAWTSHRGTTRPSTGMGRLGPKREISWRAVMDAAPMQRNNHAR